MRVSHSNKVESTEYTMEPVIGVGVKIKRGTIGIYKLVYFLKGVYNETLSVDFYRTGSGLWSDGL